MTRTENKKPLKERSIGELQFRANLATRFIELLMTNDDMKDDDRAPGAIHEYERQLEKIQAEINRREPQPVVIGLQPASLAGISPNKE